MTKKKLHPKKVTKPIPDDVYLEPVSRQEILAEEINASPVIEEDEMPKDIFDSWELTCFDMCKLLEDYKNSVSASLIDETIRSITSTITLTRRVKAKVQ